MGSIKSRCRFIRFKHLVHRTLRETCSTEVLICHSFQICRFLCSTPYGRDNIKQRAAARARIMKSRNPCKRRTVNAPHSRKYTYVYKCVYVLALLLNYPLLLRARIHLARTRIFLLTATTAHTYDAPAMTNSNTWTGKGAGER